MSCPNPNKTDFQSALTCPDLMRQARQQPWSLTLEQYLEVKKADELRRLENNLRYYQKELAETSLRATKKRDELKMWIRITEKDLERFKAEGPSPFKLQEWRNAYIETVKRAISKGEPVSDEIVAQFPEFKTAKTGRQRYEKGRHTSFANRSAAVDDSMQAQLGYKIKRQDGKPMTDEQAQEIATGIKEIESVFGDLSDLYREADLTIAHTNGKHPFLSTCGGMYIVEERTISTGVRSKRSKKLIPTLGHLWALWLDEEAGKKLCAITRVRRGEKFSTAASIAENDTYFRRGGCELYELAMRTVNSSYQVKRLLDIAGGRGGAKDADEATRDAAEHAKVAVGHYYRLPSEIFARLVEQYISTKVENPQVAVKADYTRIPGYWDAEAWKQLEPLVEREIQRRLAIMRGQSDEKAESVVFSKSWFSPATGEKITAHLGYGSNNPKSVDLVRDPGDTTWRVVTSFYNAEQRKWDEQVFGAGLPSLEDAKMLAEAVIMALPD